MRLHFAAALGAALLSLTSPASGQPAAQRPSPDCRDDRGVDRCSPEQHRRVLDLYGLQPIEAHRDAGDQVRRAFYVDGYGRDLVAITFIRSHGRDPRLLVHHPRRSGDRQPRPHFEALVPAEAWQQVLARSENFDRKLVPVPGAASAAPICLHSWVYTVEATEFPRFPNQPPSVRRAVEDACSDALAQPYAVMLGEAALPLLPFCAVLDPELHRSTVTRLAACAALEGDRMAAAEAHNVALRLSRADQPGEDRIVRQLFDWRGRLDWSGETASGDAGQAAKAWFARTAGEQNANLYIDRAIGERRDRVRVEGRVLRSVEREGGATQQLQAPATLTVAFSPNLLQWQVEQATVGAFAPAGN